MLNGYVCMLFECLPGIQIKPEYKQYISFSASFASLRENISMICLRGCVLDKALPFPAIRSIDH